MAQFRKSKTLETNVYDMAIQRINHAYDLFDHVAVSFSGGKDSTVILNLTLEVARERGQLPLRVIFFDEEAIPYETIDYVRRVASLPDVDFEWYCIPVRHRNACSADHPFWFPWAPEDRHKWVRDLPPEAITEIPGYDHRDPARRLSIPDLNGALFPPEQVGSAAFILGIRADESMTRRRAVSRRIHDNYIIPEKGITSRGNLSKVYPIYDWTTPDVWTAPAEHGWDYNTSYDLMEMAGIGHSRQRIAPPYGEQPMKSLWMFHVCFPDLWDRMVDRVPGAATAARYASTELYAAGRQEDYHKPDGMTWQEAIRDAIENHPEDVRGMVAHRIELEINRHNRKTGSQPILDVPHPWSGLSWPWLYRIAVRGDFKSREFALTHAADGSEESRKIAEAYEKALLKWKEEQRVKD